jgi:hypothetical protein
MAEVALDPDVQTFASNRFILARLSVYRWVDVREVNLQFVRSKHVHDRNDLKASVDW